MSSEMQLRMQYTDLERDEALRLLAEVGKAEAARRTGIPVGTIASWGSRYGVTAPVVSESRQASVAAVTATVTEGKAALAVELRGLAAKAVAKLAAKIDDDEVSPRDLVAALTAAVDRMQLLTGEATSRPELTGGEPAQRGALLAVVHNLAERAKAS